MKKILLALLLVVLLLVGFWLLSFKTNWGMAAFLIILTLELIFIYTQSKTNKQ